MKCNSHNDQATDVIGIGHHETRLSDDMFGSDFRKKNN